MKKLGYLIAAVVIVIAAFWGYQNLPSQPAATPTPALNTLEVTFLDVGQADAALIRCDGKTMLIDAGTNSGSESLVSKLKEMGISRLDVIVGTHPHEDHIGGLDAVINEFDIGQIFMPRATATTRTFQDVIQAIQDKGLTITTPQPGSTHSLGPAQFSILAPNSEDYSDTNNHSIVIRLFYGETSFLFTGDAEADSEEEMLDRGFTLEASVLKVGHHGSTTSTTDEFLAAVSPQYAVISVGEDNEYGHPNPEILDKLEAAGATIYRTDLNGDITFTLDGANLTVKTER